MGNRLRWYVLQLKLTYHNLRIRLRGGPKTHTCQSTFQIGPGKAPQHLVDSIVKEEDERVITEVLKRV